MRVHGVSTYSLCARAFGMKGNAEPLGVPLTQLGLGRMFVVFIAGDERKQLLQAREHLQQVKG